MTTATNLRSRLHRGAALTALALAVGVSAPAFAQDAPTALSDVIVTAQKRSENIQDVPVSVATMSAEKLSAVLAAGEDVVGLSSRVPGLYIESSNGRAAPRFYIRGLGNVDFDLSASQPVSMILDDVVLENVVLKSSPIFDVEQVEVLRGPQGTLFGRNTTAGIVKFDSVKPSQTFKANGTATYGTYGTATLDAGVGGPLIADKLSGRLSVLGQHRNDYIDNGFTHENKALGGYDEYAIRGQLLYTPTEAFSALLNLHNRSLVGTAAIFRANILTKGSNKINGNFDRDQVWFDQGANNPQKYDGHGGSLKMDYDFGGAKLTSISSYETTNGYSRGDIDGGYGAVYLPEMGPGFIAFQSDTQDSIDDLDQYTQELRLASDTDAPLTWQVGAYYFKSDFTVTTTSGVPLSTLQHKNTAWAAFGAGTYQVNDAFKVAAGLRWTKDDKDMHVILGGKPDVSVSDDKVSWDLSAFYDVAPDVSVYGKVASGFRGPSIQGRDIAFGADASVAKSETIMSYEAGLKSELFDRSLRLNGAVFAYTVKDMQLSAIGGAGQGNHLINADKGKAYGFEVDGEWAVNANLLLTAGYSYSHTKIDDSDLTTAPCGSGICTVTDPVVAGAAQINGNPFPNAPKSILTFTARYSYPIGDGELFAYTDWFRQGYTNIFLYESKEFYTKGDFEGGLKLGYAKQDGSYEIAAFARNITNEVNLKGGIDFNNNTGFVNEPRIIGISISARR